MYRFLFVIVISALFVNLRPISWSEAAIQQPAAVKEVYEKVGIPEFAFSFSSECGSVSYANGENTYTDCDVATFSLSGKPIEIETKSITSDGFVITKKFGKVKTTTDSRMRTTIWLTPSQKRAFKIFASQESPK
jgi:hypothetical protein